MSHWQASGYFVLNLSPTLIVTVPTPLSTNRKNNHYPTLILKLRMYEHTSMTIPHRLTTIQHIANFSPILTISGISSLAGAVANPTYFHQCQDGAIM